MRNEEIHAEMLRQVEEQKKKNLPRVIVPYTVDTDTNTIWVLYDDYIEGSKRMFGLWSSRDQHDFSAMTEEEIALYVSEFVEAC